MSNVDQYECLFQFNKAMHNALLTLDALTRHQGFDPAELNALAISIRRMTARTNSYLISAVASVEAGMLTPHTQ